MDPGAPRNQHLLEIGTAVTTLQMEKLGEVALIVNLILQYCYVTNNSTISVDFNNKHRLL